MPVVLETQRLRLRELGWEDLEPLAEILSDEETMAHYPAPFDRAKVERWISWNLENYRVFGFGLWAVEEKGSGAFLGDCGITIQILMGPSGRKSDIISTNGFGAGAMEARRPVPVGIGRLPIRPLGKCIPT